MKRESPIYDGLHNTVNDSACRQAHRDALTDFELSIVWLLWGRHFTALLSI
jgi:hypothetical protein